MFEFPQKVRRIQMHKDSKWAKSIIALQEPDGKWGWFHSLSQSYDAPITTEQALRRLERLGYTIEDKCIQKAVLYMDNCLTGKTQYQTDEKNCIIGIFLFQHVGNMD